MYEEKIIKEATCLDYGEKICKENGKIWLVKMPMLDRSHDDIVDAFTYMMQSLKHRKLKWYQRLWRWIKAKITLTNKQ